jgi:DNA-binding XRE family transcriptional regulator
MFNAEKFSKDVKMTRGKLSYRQASAVSHVSPATLNRIEQGRPPDMKTFMMLCQWMGKTGAEYKIKRKRQ